LVILPRAVRLLRAAVRVLLEATPEHLDLDDVRRHIREADHVRDVHDLHAYTVTSDLPVLTAHVVVDEECFRDGHAPQMLDAVQTRRAGQRMEKGLGQQEPARDGGTDAHREAHGDQHGLGRPIPGRKANAMIPANSGGSRTTMSASPSRS
jgi:cobalt-zinc-cadmium efflux system protein